MENYKYHSIDDSGNIHFKYSDENLSHKWLGGDEDNEHWSSVIQGCGCDPGDFNDFKSFQEWLYYETGLHNWEEKDNFTPTIL